MVTREELKKALAERHGPETQEILARSGAAVAGLGGLGSNIAFSLARTGVGYLHLIDFDRVDITNLNRQQYFIHQIGMKKTEALKENLLQINPYLEIRTDFVKVEEGNIRELLEEDRYICEAFDKAENKAMLVNAVLEHFPEKYLAAASGMAGFGDSNRIRTRKITDHFYLCGDGTSDAEEGICLTAARAALCAAHQANIIISLMLENEEEKIKGEKL